MKVLIVEPKKAPYEADIPNTLAAEQKVVGGLIDCVYPYDDPVCIVANDEGLINGMPFNRLVAPEVGICGTFFVCGVGDENFTSLTPEQIDKYKALLHDYHIPVKINGRLTFLPMSPDAAGKAPPSPQPVKKPKHRGGSTR